MARCPYIYFLVSPAFVFRKYHHGKSLILSDSRNPPHSKLDTDWHALILFLRKSYDCMMVLVGDAKSLFLRNKSKTPTLNEVPGNREIFYSSFLVACYATLHPALSVRWSVGPLVRHTLLFFMILLL